MKNLPQKGKETQICELVLIWKPAKQATWASEDREQVKRKEAAAWQVGKKKPPKEILAFHTVLLQFPI